MHAILAIIGKDILQWTRRPLYFFASVLLAILIIVCVGSTISGADDMPFGLYDPAGISDLSKDLTATRRFKVALYQDLNKAKADLEKEKIVALANVSQDPLEDSVEILTVGNNPLIDQQISSGLLAVLTSGSGELNLPIHSKSLVPVDFGSRDYISAGLIAYLCYVLASMNLVLAGSTSGWKRPTARLFWLPGGWMRLYWLKC